jgi:hypothetical protein
LGRPIAAPLERCAELLGVDLATVRELAVNVEPYVRADGTEVWSLMQLERQLQPEAYRRRRAATLTADGPSPPTHPGPEGRRDAGGGPVNGLAGGAGAASGPLHPAADRPLSRPPGQVSHHRAASRHPMPLWGQAAAVAASEVRCDHAVASL